MTTDAEGVSKTEDRKSGFGAAAPLAVVAGLGAVLAAGVALWSAQGAEIFLAQAFAALAACF